MKRHAYTYLILRHTGGIDGGESLNVGVVLCAPGAVFAGARFRTEAGRIAAAFPEIDTRVFADRMRKLSIRVEALCAETHGHTHALDLAKGLLAQNEAARLNWELVERAGVTTDPAAELDYLFRDLVTGRDAEFSKKFAVKTPDWGIGMVSASTHATSHQGVRATY